MREVLGLILGGGRGERLYPLTQSRSEPAVPLAGKYRLIDIPISNCINSNLQHLYVLTQFLSVSLHRHIANAYQLDHFTRGFIEVLAAQQTYDSTNWYRGTADAVRQNIRYLLSDEFQDILLLSGDQLYRLDFRDMLRVHRAAQADVTVAVHPVHSQRATQLGIVQLAADRRVTKLVEKPQSLEELADVQTPTDQLSQLGLPTDSLSYLANMGIYLFNRNKLVAWLSQEQPNAMDLVREMLAPHLKTRHVQAYLHQGYWDDIGSIRTYFESHLALANESPPFNFYDAQGVIYTRMRHLPASSVQAARVDHCLISDGCHVQSGAKLSRSVLGVRSRVEKNVVLNETIMMGSTRYETDSECSDAREQGQCPLGVGADSHIERTIIDKNCRVGKGVRITNATGRVHFDGPNYFIREGIVVLPKGTYLPAGTVI